MRKLTLVLAVLLVAALLVIYYPSYVEKPLKDGPGPLAVYVAAQYTAPEYHSPLASWQLSHVDMFNRGDLVQADCLYCHLPEKSCNNCHSYVGANPIQP